MKVRITDIPKAQTGGDITLYKPKDTQTSIPIQDTRKTDVITGKKIVDKGNLSKKIDSQTAKEIISEARKAGIDPLTALAISYQESGIAKGKPFNLNPDVFGKPFGNAQEGIQSLKNMFAYAKSLQNKGKIPSSEEYFLQGNNGYGKIKKGHADLEGSTSIYGLPIPDEGINFMKNPLYGKRILDIRDNILKNNQNIQSLLNEQSENNFKYGGNTMRVRIMDIPITSKMQTGGKPLQQTGGLPPGQEHQANIEAENGEVYQNTDGGFTKISDNAPSHEEGGVPINDAERVLEDTSMDRKDKHSKALKISPGEMKEIFGFKPKRGVSHAKAFELAKTHFDKQRGKFNTAQKDLNDQNIMDKFSIASSKQNFVNREFVPDEQDVFDTLFAHQEAIKEVNDIPTGGKENKYGGYLPKAQYGKSRKPAERIFEDRYLKPSPVTATTIPYDSSIDTSKVIPNDGNIRIVEGLNPEPGSSDRQPVKPGVGVNPRFINQPKNQFSEPTRWYDLAPGIMELVDSMGRDPELYNPIQMHQLKYKLLNPTAAVQANQADFNSAAQALGNQNVGSGVASANMANLLAQKYKANNQIMADYENRNAAITNQEIGYNTSVRDRQSLADAQSREKYYADVLKGRDNQRMQKLQAVQDLSRVAQLKARQNRSGNLILKMTPAFDQYGEYNGYQYVPVLPPEYQGDQDFIPQSRTSSKNTPKTRTTTTTKLGDKVVKTTTSK